MKLKFREQTDTDCCENDKEEIVLREKNLTGIERSRQKKLHIVYEQQLETQNHGQFVCGERALSEPNNDTSSIELLWYL